MRLSYRPNEYPRLRYETNPRTSKEIHPQKVNQGNTSQGINGREEDIELPDSPEIPGSQSPQIHYLGQLPQGSRYQLPWGAFLYLPEPPPEYLTRLVRHGRLRAAQAVQATLGVAADQVIQETMEGLEVLASQVAEKGMKEEEDPKSRETHKDQVDHQVARSLLNHHNPKRKPKRHPKERERSETPRYSRGTESKLRHSSTPSSSCSLEDQTTSQMMPSKSQVPSPTWKAQRLRRSRNLSF